MIHLLGMVQNNLKLKRRCTIVKKVNMPWITETMVIGGAINVVNLTIKVIGIIVVTSAMRTIAYLVYPGV